MQNPKLNNLCPISLRFRKPRGQQSRTNLRELGWTLILWCAVFVVASAIGMGKRPDVEPGQARSDLEVFVRQGCPHCDKAKPTLARLKQRYPQLTVTIHDIGEDPEALLRLKTLAAKFGIMQLGVPAFYGRGELVIGFESDATTGKQLEELLGQPPPDAGAPSGDTCPLEPEAPCAPASAQGDIGG